MTELPPSRRGSVIAVAQGGNSVSNLHVPSRKGCIREQEAVNALKSRSLIRDSEDGSNPKGTEKDIHRNRELQIAASKPFHTCFFSGFLCPSAMNRSSSSTALLSSLHLSSLL